MVTKDTSLILTWYNLARKSNLELEMILNSYSGLQDIQLLNMLNGWKAPLNDKLMMTSVPWL